MFAVAIDGPSGAGKSSVSKAVAKNLGIMYVDTGALYRTVALFLLQNNIDFADEQAVKKVLPQILVEMKYADGEQRMMLNGTDVSDEIRTQEVSNAASVSSGLPAVRDFLFKLQTDMAKRYDVIMDGRDIGTVVLPNADVKIFLTASAEERARRRYEQLKSAGEEVVYETILKEVEERDYRDSHREIAPLKPSDDSIVVDSTENKVEETIEQITNLIREKMA